MPTEDDQVCNEKQLEHLILDWLVAQDKCFAVKLNNVGIYNKRKGCYMMPNNRHIHRGLPDILGVFDGRFLAVEVKFGKNKPSEHQTRFIKRVQEANGVAFWCNSFSDFKYKFNEYFNYP